jgi:hypothetical protein
MKGTEKGTLPSMMKRSMRYKTVETIPMKAGIKADKKRGRRKEGKKERER